MSEDETNLELRHCAQAWTNRRVKMRLDKTTSYHSSHSRLSSRWFSKTSSVHDVVSKSIQSLVSSPTMRPSLAIASQILYPFDTFSIRHALESTSHPASDRVSYKSLITTAETLAPRNP